MLTTLQINDKYALVFGMHWSVVDPLESRHDKLAELRQNGAQWTATFKRSGEENIGTTDAVSPFAKSTIVLSGAGQFATLPQFSGKSALLLLEDEGTSGNQGVVAVVGIINGNVSIDRLLTPAEAKAERERFHELCERARQDYVTVGYVRTLEPVNDRLNWPDLLPQKQGRFKTTKEVRVRPLRSERFGQIINGTIAASMVLGVAFYGWTKYDEHLQRKRAMEEAQRVNPEVLYAASVKTFMEQPKPLLKDAISTIQKSVGQLDSHRRGWKLNSITCTPDSCELQWDRDGGTFAEFADQAPQEWTNIAYSNDGGQIVHSMPLSIPKTLLPPVEQWKSMNDFKKNSVSEWQRFSEVAFQFSFDNPTLEAVPPGVAAEALANSPNAIRSASWQARGDWYMSDGLKRVPSTLTFVGLKIVLSPATVTFETTGKVYVKN